MSLELKDCLQIYLECSLGQNYDFCLSYQALKRVICALILEQQLILF
jgi:hypothetical protein